MSLNNLTRAISVL